MGPTRAAAWSGRRWARPPKRWPGSFDNTYATLARHWDEDEIVEILGVICMFGVFNRWSDSLATTLEDDAVEIAQSLLEDSGWHVGNHSLAGSEGRPVPTVCDGL